MARWYYAGVTRVIRAAGTYARLLPEVENADSPRPGSATEKSLYV